MVSLKPLCVQNPIKRTRGQVKMGRRKGSRWWIMGCLLWMLTISISVTQEEERASPEKSRGLKECNVTTCLTNTTQVVEPSGAEEVEWIVDVMTTPVHITHNSNSTSNTTCDKWVEPVQQGGASVSEPDTPVDASTQENVTRSYEAPDDDECDNLDIEYDDPLTMWRARPRGFRPGEENRWELARENSWYKWVWYTSREMTNEECIVCTRAPIAATVVVPERHSFRTCAEEQKKE